MTCADCGADTGKRYGRYCDAHRWRHRGKPATYRLTPEREAYMREHYQPSVRGISYRCARALDVPKWRICRWAAELGLTGPSTKGPNWTPQEDAFLEAHLGTRHLNWIAKRLKRSLTAVTVRAKRLEISRRDARTWDTAREVGICFGVDSKVVARWIERGWLAARHEGQDYPGGRPAAWRIEHEAVRRFAQEHPTAYTLAKVDQTWFLDMVFGGTVGDVALKAEAATEDGRSGQTVRVFKLARLLATCRVCPDIDTLAAQFSVTTRTIRRDIDALRAAGEPVPPMADRQVA